MSGLEGKLLEIQGYWLREAKSRAGESLRNVVSGVLTQLYVEPGQFILEFLQNAEDALMEARRMGLVRNEEERYFKIELYKDKVVISHDGKPFDERDLEGLCGIRSNKKPALGYKGFIGIGWKSVFLVSNRVEVHSEGLFFEFNRDYWRSELAKGVLDRYGLKPEDVIWQLTPIPIQPTTPVSKETKFVVHLDEARYESVARIVGELGPSLFLFLDSINKVKIENYVEGKNKVIEWFVKSEEEFENAKVRKVNVMVAEDGVSTSHKFIVFKKEFEVPEDVRKDPVTVNAKRGDVVKREVALAFSLDPATDDLRPLEEKQQFWGMYSFLPLYEVRTGLRFLVQADFIVHPGRRYLHVEAKWNRWLMECAAELARIAIEYLRKKYKKSYLTVFAHHELNEEVYKRLIEPTIVSTISKVLSDPVVLCYRDHEVKLGNVVEASEEIFELIKHGLFSEDELKHIFGDEKHILDPDFKLGEYSYRVRHLGLPDILNEKLIRAKMEKSFEEAVIFLSETYKMLYNKYKNYRYVIQNKELVLTSSLCVKHASNTYLPVFDQKVEECRKRYPKVDEYLRSLDFVHEKLIESLGVEILKWLGVREVGLEELVEGVLLREISVDAPPRGVDELLAISLLARVSGVVLEKPVWVVTVGGSIEKSSEVYHPVKEVRSLKDYREIMEKLGFKVLDIDKYLSYDADEEGWRSFFSKVVKGAEFVEWVQYGDYYRRALHRDYWEIFKRIKKALETSPIEDNTRLIRFLKGLYDLGFKTYLEETHWKDLTPLKLVTDEGTLADSDRCLLHDEYGSKEKWARWRDEGFPVGPFVSSRYTDDPSRVSSWRDFFRNLGVREEAGAELVERFAEWFVERKLASRGYKVVGKGEKGYDIRAVKGGEEVYVEVKGRRSEEPEDVKLTELESQVAHKYGERYWLVVVVGIPNNPRALVLRDPARYGTEIAIPGRKLKECGEEL
jgi:hypothetical protein